MLHGLLDPWAARLRDGVRLLDPQTSHCHSERGLGLGQCCTGSLAAPAAPKSTQVLITAVTETSWRACPSISWLWMDGLSIRVAMVTVKAPSVSGR